MDAKSFFYLVSEMRDAQRNYFRTRDRKVFVAARVLEDQVDKEIMRVKSVVAKNESEQQKQDQNNGH